MIRPGRQSHGCAGGSRLLQADEESLELVGETGVPSNCIIIKVTTAIPVAAAVFYTILVYVI